MPASIRKFEGRNFVVDSGASKHMISEKDLSDAEMDTLTKSCSFTIFIPPMEKCKRIKGQRCMLSLGTLCDENRYSYESINGQKPHLITKRESDTLQYGEIRSHWFQACQNSFSGSSSTLKTLSR